MAEDGTILFHSLLLIWRVRNIARHGGGNANHESSNRLRKQGNLHRCTDAKWTPNHCHFLPLFQSAERVFCAYLSQYKLDFIKGIRRSRRLSTGPKRGVAVIGDHCHREIRNLYTIRWRTAGGGRTRCKRSGGRLPARSIGTRISFVAGFNTEIGKLNPAIKSSDNSLVTP